MWLLVAAAVIGAAVLIVVLTRMRPDYDAFGWLVWGKQVLHWNLNTDGAPSWKPLTFIFTLPYALAGAAQMWLWMVTAVAGALAGCVFAARIAFRLTGEASGRRWAPYVAGLVAAAALLGIDTYSRLILIANSDPLIVTLCLAAIDSHLSQRPRLAFAMVIGASLGRPEAWVFALLYGAWLWWRLPRATVRLAIVASLVLIPAFWFTIPALTSHSWLIAGKLALHQHTMIQGNKITGVIGRYRGLCGLPVQLLALIAVVLALARRDLATLGLAACAVVWVVIEIVFAFHGWSAVTRYMIEPAGVMVVLAGAGVGRLAADSRGWGVLRWAGPVVALALLVALVPTARTRARAARLDLDIAHAHAKQVTRLQGVIARIGGPAKIKSCGQPVSLVGFQSTVAYEVGLNVGNVGFRPGRAIDRGDDIVLFKPHDLGWQVRLYNLPVAKQARCAALRTDSITG
ncbi:MAG: hypothetical protein ACRDLV_14090 [Solirubrobacteraceae bacterium]